MSDQNKDDGKGKKADQPPINLAEDSDASFYTARSHLSNEDEPPPIQPRNASDTDFAPSEQVLKVQPLKTVTVKDAYDDSSDDSSYKKDIDLLAYRDRRKRNDPSGSQFSLKSASRKYAFIYMVKPPDGGYGWVIVVFSFFTQVVVDGIIFSIGVSLPAIAKEFNVSVVEVCLISSMQMGAFASAFINKYGFRPVAIFGSILAMVTIVIASFSVNLAMMIIFFSVIGGPALSSIWVPSQLIIGYYFEKYRPIANGLSCSGAGAGIMIFVIMNNYLVPIIGWRNMQRVHVGFLFIVLFMTFSFRPVPPTRIGQIKEDDTDTEDTSEENESHVISLRYSTPSLFSTKSGYRATKLYPKLEEYEPTERKPNCCQRFCRCCCRPRPKVRKLEPSVLPRKSYLIRTDPLERQDYYYMGPADYSRERRPDDIIPDGIDILPGQNTEAIRYNLSLMNTRPGAEGKQQKPSSLTCCQKMAPKRWMSPKIMAAFRMLFDFRLFKIFEFRVLILSAFLFPMGFNIPFLYSKARAQIDEFAASMIGPSIGLSNFIFRIVSGFLAYYYRKYTTYMCGWGLIFGGVAVLVSAFCLYDAVWFQICYALAYGIAPAFFSTLRAIIYVRYLGLEKLTNAFGLISLLMGLGVFIGTTVAGLLNHFTGDYVASFTFSGVCIIASGTLKLIMPYLVQWRNQGRCCFKKRVAK